MESQKALGGHVQRRPGTVTQLRRGRDIEIAPKTKVAEENAAGLIEQDVRGFDVPVSHPRPVSDFQRPRDSVDDAGDLP